MRGLLFHHATLIAAPSTKSLAARPAVGGHAHACTFPSVPPPVVVRPNPRWLVHPITPRTRYCLRAGVDGGPEARRAPSCQGRRGRFFADLLDCLILLCSPGHCASRSRSRVTAALPARRSPWAFPWRYASPWRWDVRSRSATAPVLGIRSCPCFRVPLSLFRFYVQEYDPWELTVVDPPRRGSGSGRGEEGGVVR